MDLSKLGDLISFIAGTHGFRQGIIEKDFYITLVLNNISEHLSDSLVFKGGTLLNKIYLNYHRLSEDLDFTLDVQWPLDSRSKRSSAIMPVRKNMAGLLTATGLKSDNPKGKGFDNSKQYVFEILYPSLITGKDETVRLEISLRHSVIDKPVLNKINHFYQDPFTGKPLIPNNTIKSLSLVEATAEKLKAAISRKEIAIRDFYDLWHISELKFDFFNKKFIKIFRQKLKEENIEKDFSVNFGLDQDTLDDLHHRIETELAPVIKSSDDFRLDRVLGRFNQILKKIKN
jgi:predicted nucleotidyltransferase component of viral defense system